MQYAIQNIFLIKKSPTLVTVTQIKGRHITKGHFAAKSTVDYDGTYRCKSIVFEAKSTEETRYPLRDVKDHQLTFLNQAEKHGAVAFVLSEFSKGRKYFYCPMSFINVYVKKANEGGHKSIPLADFDVYAFEVGRERLSLDYLAVTDRMQERES